MKANLVKDLRSWHSRILDVKKTKPSQEKNELAELRNLIESTHIIDDLF